MNKILQGAFVFFFGLHNLCAQEMSQFTLKGTEASLLINKFFAAGIAATPPELSNAGTASIFAFVLKEVKCKATNKMHHTEFKEYTEIFRVIECVAKPGGLAGLNFPDEVLNLNSSFYFVLNSLPGVIRDTTTNDWTISIKNLSCWGSASWQVPGASSKNYQCDYTGVKKYNSVILIRRVYNAIFFVKTS